jgi:hypothetical protein
VDHEHHDGALEPSVLEREPFRRSNLDRAHPIARESGHLRRRLYAPDARPAFGQRCSDTTGAATDVEHAPADEVALAGEQLEEGPPVGVGGPKLVVVGRDTAEIRFRRRALQAP